MDIDTITARVSELEKQRDDGTADAETETAGMREVALFRAANAAACLGQLTRPLLNEVIRLRDYVEDLEQTVGAAMDNESIMVAEIDALRTCCQVLTTELTGI